MLSVPGIFAAEMELTIGEGCTVGPGLVALAAPAQFPHSDTVGHHGGGCVTEVEACSGHRHTDKYVGARAKQMLLSCFIFFSRACLYEGHSTSVLFQPENQKYLSLTVCQYRRVFKIISPRTKKIHSECHFGICQISCCFTLGSAGCFMKNPLKVPLSF